MICEACIKAADRHIMSYHLSCPNFKPVVNAGSNFCDCQHQEPGVYIVLPVAEVNND